MEDFKSKMIMKLAIVSSCYNKQEILKDSAARLIPLLDDLVARGKISSDSFILFVNDASKDLTWEMISELFQKKPYVLGINLAKHIGPQHAMIAGMMAAKEMSDAVITLDVNLQDDLSAIEKMIDKCHQGYDIVYGVEVSTEPDSFYKRTATEALYKMQHQFDVEVIYNHHTDFRLMNHRALEQLSLYKERNLYLKGILPLIGYNTTTVENVIHPTKGQKSRCSLIKRLKTVLDGITSFSIKPMQLILGFGLCSLAISILMFCHILYSFFMTPVVSDWIYLMFSVWFIGSIVLLSLGIIGQYVGKIYIEVKQRPLYNIETCLYDKTIYRSSLPVAQKEQT